MARPGDEVSSQTRALGASVVAEHSRTGDAQSCVLADAFTVILRHEGFVRGKDRDSHHRLVAVMGSIVSLVAEAVGADEVRSRRVLEGTIAIEVKRDSMARSGD